MITDGEKGHKLSRDLERLKVKYLFQTDRYKGAYNVVNNGLDKLIKFLKEVKFN